MKNYLIIKGILVAFIFFSFIGSVQILFAQDSTDIPILPNLSDLEGTWLEENDSSSKWVFHNNNANYYYDNELIFSFTYRVSDTSPQCGEEVQTGDKIEFLELTDTSDGEQKCYYINGLNGDTLSLSPFGQSFLLVLIKQ